jgi:hypothetical protein
MKNNASDLKVQADIHFNTKTDRRYPVKATFRGASGCEFVIIMASAYEINSQFPQIGRSRS